MATNWCSNCGSAPVRANGKCMTCYHYKRRTGRDRPEELVIAKNVRDFEEDLIRKRRVARGWDPNW